MFKLIQFPSRFLIGSFLCIFSIGLAVAQSSVPFYGPYIGISVGYSNTGVGENSINWTDNANSGTTTGGSNSSANGVIATINYGFNWRSQNLHWQNFVFGAEMTGSLPTGTSNSTAADHTLIGGSTFDLDRISSQTKIQGLATAKPKFGFVMNQKTMIYVMGGLAWGQTNRTLTQESTGNSVLFKPNSSITSSKGQFGYTAGLGIERMIDENLSLKLEFNYIDLGNVSFSYSGVIPAPGSTSASIIQSSKITNSAATIGINYRF